MNTVRNITLTLAGILAISSLFEIVAATNCYTGVTLNAVQYTLKLSANNQQRFITDAKAFARNTATTPTATDAAFYQASSGAVIPLSFLNIDTATKTLSYYESRNTSYTTATRTGPFFLCNDVQ